MQPAVHPDLREMVVIPCEPLARHDEQIRASPLEPPALLSVAKQLLVDDPLAVGHDRIECCQTCFEFGTQRVVARARSHWGWHWPRSTT